MIRNCLRASVETTLLSDRLPAQWTLVDWFTTHCTATDMTTRQKHDRRLYGVEDNIQIIMIMILSTINTVELLLAQNT